MGLFEQYADEPTDEGMPVAAPEEPRVAIEPVQAPTPPAEDPLIGSVVAGCRVEEWINSDGISNTYRAFQVSMERPVALRVLASQLTNTPDAAERFICAARAGGKLSHPNIVQVFDAGEDNGVCFVLLELVDGHSVRVMLQERGRKRALEKDAAVDFAAQIAEALDYAHNRSVVHRSITPDTVLVTRHGIAKLAETGFVQNLEESGIDRPSRPGEQVDALHFSAPEVQSSPRNASPQSDIYSLGAVLFLMLSGHPPFRGGSEMEIMKMVQQGRHQSLSKLQPSIPDDLVQIVDRALSVRPDHRYTTAGEFQTDLRQARERLRR